MSLPQLPAGQELGLYASDAFLVSAQEAGARQLDINTGEVNDVIRMARASGTIPNLGGIALLAPQEIEPATEGEIVKYGEAFAGDVVQERVMLNQFVRGQIADRASWGQVIAEHGAESKSLFSLGVEPDEGKIATALYEAAYVLPGRVENDEWMNSTLGNTGSKIVAGILTAGFKIAGKNVGDFGQDLGQLRKSVDMQTVGNKRPVLLRAHIS